MRCSSIALKEIAKKFQRKWIFKDIDCTLNTNDVISITGNNGAGKSTLLKIISGHLSPNKGTLSYFDSDNQVIGRDDIYKHTTFAAPYINLMSRLNLVENIDFYCKFKNLQPGLNKDTFIDLIQLKQSAHKELRFYSSGMQQRVKLAFAICADSSVLILDEPTSNLDDEGAKWFTQTLQKYSSERIIIIASNAQRDFDLCNRSLSILDYKKQKLQVK